MLLGTALISATAAFCAVKFQRAPVFQRIEASPIVGAFDSVALPVPVEYVPAGKRVREVHFKSVNFPRQQVPQGALTSLDPVADAITVAALPANLPLFRENFTQNGSALNPVVERIPPGMRAMTIRVDATTAVEGWAGSGSIVDVLLVEKDRTSVVAEKVKVLSAERSVVPVEGASAPSVPSTVTLLVSQEQCLAINTAIPRGKIAFALRSTKDDDNWRDLSFTAERLNGVATSERKAVVTGYLEIEGKDANQSFALADGKWTKTETVPQGFLVGGSAK